MRQQNRASETAQEIIVAFQFGVKRLIKLKGEVEDLKKVVKELQLVDQGLDSRGMYVIQITGYTERLFFLYVSRLPVQTFNQLTEV